MELMSRSSERGVVHILLLVVLLAGLAFGVYLVQQRTNLFSKASSHPLPPCPLSAPCPVPTNTPTPVADGGPVQVTPTPTVNQPAPQPTGPVIDLPNPLPDIPVPPIFSPAPIAIPTVVPTPTLAPTSNSWGADTAVVCQNGSTPQKPERTRLVYAVWPDEPYDLNNPVKFKRTEFSYEDPNTQAISITNNLSVSSVYIGIETESGQFLQAYGRPQDGDIEYGQFFGVNMVRWYKNDLPKGYYDIPFQAPESWCR
jgi:hypothetical protein